MTSARRAPAGLAPPQFGSRHSPQGSNAGEVFGVHISAVREEEFRHAGVARVEQRSPARVVGGVDIGAMREEEFRHVPVISAHGKSKRGSAKFARGIDIGTIVQQ